MNIIKLIYQQKLLLTILVLTNLFSSSAQGQEKSLLWEISGNGLKQKSYLFGTIHIIKKNDFFLSDIMKEKLKSSSLLVTEIAMKVPLAKQIELAKKMFLPEDKTIESYLSKEDFVLLKTYILDTLKIKKGKFKKYMRLKPFFLSSVISAQQIGDVKSYEKEFEKLAQKYNLNNIGLETIDYQLSVVETMSIEDQAKSLLSDIKTSGNNSASMDNLTKAYKEQDIEKLYTIISSESDEMKGFMENFLFTRNKNWIPLIENIVKVQSAFIAVGAGHLGGENGLINLLKKDGYILTPIK